MDRRWFAAGILGWPIAVLAESRTENKWKAGVNYITLPTSLASSLPPGRVEVVEIFSYTCVHCYHFEPILRQWLARKPQYVEFVKIPGVWVEFQRPYAALYYALRRLGRSDLEQYVFEGIHGDRSLPVRDPEAINDSLLKFAEKHGISESDFKGAMGSASVQTQLQTDARLVEAYQVVATPSIVVDRKYESDASRVLASSEKAGEAAFGLLIELTDQLVMTEAALLHLPS